MQLGSKARQGKVLCGKFCGPGLPCRLLHTLSQTPVTPSVKAKCNVRPTFQSPKKEARAKLCQNGPCILCCHCLCILLRPKKRKVGPEFLIIGLTPDCHCKSRLHILPPDTCNGQSVFPPPQEVKLSLSSIH